MIVEQTLITLRSRPRGAHLITAEIDDALCGLQPVDRGLAHLHLMHTSAALTLNENSDPDVRSDLTAIMDHLVPEKQPWYRHTLEGPDDSLPMRRVRRWEWALSFRYVTVVSCLARGRASTWSNPGIGEVDEGSASP